ncbi:type VII secretion-associated serine protease mycosin [Nocardia sp. NBC_01503]|uniref:type VII secretion-associated serine protease mycosin n=1 Tax=Nocardia sp. NBC_01503 TaxID=2975997 RepID=UPI002E7B31D9|nr:type VII secretion-associated serine protease mycosin [Nocardia sp. NBC_01503]WTL29919.1 type VII secretion-associated serine protease mycosin [Nocardia sp. NBC_01503]
MRIAGASALLAVLLALAPMAAPASAVQPPEVATAPPPADDTPGPELPTKQDKGCVAVGVLPHSDPSQVPPPERALDLRRVRALSTGAGVTVAIIDTGVGPNSRLPNLVGGGDYVQAGGDGLSDCDAHGTLIAGIIGAAADPADGFAGVAPDAHLISIRYRSGAYSLDGLLNLDAAQKLSVQIRELARAITHAANLGAQVITVALPVCVPAGLGVDQSTLSAAVNYASRIKGALIVAGAGGSGNGCEQNPDIDPGRPTDPRNWTGVKTISTPGWFATDVLTVGFTTATGDVMADSLTGPWVSVAAPGTGIESLGPGGGDLINGVGEPGKLNAVGGASFAAAYASGVAALLRSRYPNESPAEIAARLQASAHAPARGIDNIVGAGLIDPLAALSYRNAPAAPAGLYRGAVLDIPAPPRAKDRRPGITALCVVVAAALLGVGSNAAYGMFRRRR